MIVNASFFFLIFSAVIETSCHLLMGKLSIINMNRFIYLVLCDKIGLFEKQRCI